MLVDLGCDGIIHEQRYDSLANSCVPDDDRTIRSSQLGGQRGDKGHLLE